MTTENTDVTKQEPKDPIEFLAQFANAPTKEQIEGWKTQAPGNQIRMKASRDGKRVWIMRGIGGTELSQLQAKLPQNLAPERMIGEMHVALAIRCCLWTSTTPDGKLNELTLKASGSGLPSTLHEIISQLSDYEDPETIDRLSADL